MESLEKEWVNGLITSGGEKMASDLFGIIPASWFNVFDGFLNDSFWVIIIGLFVVAGVGLGIKRYKDKETFKFPVRIYRRREGKQPKELNCLGGFIKHKDQIQMFRIKMHKWKWWMKVDLMKLPDARYMDDENRVYYYQLDPSTYVQARRIFCEKPADTYEMKFVRPYLAYKTGDTIEVPAESASEYLQRGLTELVKVNQNFVLDAYYEPVPTDTKRQVVSTLSNIREVLKIDIFKIQTLAIWALIIISVTFLIAYYILNARGAG